MHKQHLMILLLLLITGCSPYSNMSNYAKLDDANLTETDLPLGWKIVEPPNYYRTYPGFSYFLQKDDENLGALLFVYVYDKPASHMPLPSEKNITIGTAKCFSYEHETIYPDNWPNPVNATRSLNVTELSFTCTKNNVEIETVLHSGTRDSSTIRRNAAELIEAIFRKLRQD